jgi:hypothetical protein
MKGFIAEFAPVSIIAATVTLIGIQELLQISRLTSDKMAIGEMQQ